MYKNRTIEEKFVLFNSAEECADNAAPIFAKNRWRWTRTGIPSRDQILETLQDLKATQDRNPQFGHVGTGRLIYCKGKFGHEREKVTQ